MCIFDPRYEVEMKIFMFSEYNMNKFIGGQMIYIIDDDYKNNIV